MSKQPHFKMVPNGKWKPHYDPETGEFVEMREDTDFVRVNPGEPGYDDAPFEEIPLFHPMIFTQAANPLTPHDPTV